MPSAQLFPDRPAGVVDHVECLRPLRAESASIDCRHHALREYRRSHDELSVGRCVQAIPIVRQRYRVGTFPSAWSACGAWCNSSRTGRRAPLATGRAVPARLREAFVGLAIKEGPAAFTAEVVLAQEKHEQGQNDLDLPVAQLELDRQFNHGVNLDCAGVHANWLRLAFIKRPCPALALDLSGMALSVGLIAFDCSTSTGRRSVAQHPVAPEDGVLWLSHL